MSVLISAFVLGVVCGLRAVIGLAAVTWAAYRQQLPLEGTWLSFLGFRFTPYITSLLALAEIINDKLPNTPSRLVPPQFGARVVMGALTGTPPDCSETLPGPSDFRMDTSSLLSLLDSSAVWLEHSPAPGPELSLRNCSDAICPLLCLRMF